MMASVHAAAQRLTVAEVTRAYKAGMTGTAMAAKFGVSPSTILSRIDQAGLPRRSRGWRKPVHVERLRAAYEKGATLEALAAKFGVSSSTVANRLREAGIEPRPRAGTRLTAKQVPLPMRRIRVAYEGGASAQALGDRYSVSSQTILNRLRADGVEIRATGRRA